MQMTTIGIPNGNQMETQLNLTKPNLSKDKGESSISFLKEIPEEDIEKLTARFDITSKQLKSKGEDLFLYCKSKGRVYRDYRSFLLNALKKDFKEKSPDGKKFIQGVGWVK